LLGRNRDLFKQLTDDYRTFDSQQKFFGGCSILQHIIVDAWLFRKKRAGLDSNSILVILSSVRGDEHASLKAIENTNILRSNCLSGFN
jgi:hypothetical protein